MISEQKELEDLALFRALSGLGSSFHARGELMLLFTQYLLLKNSSRISRFSFASLTGSSAASCFALDSIALMARIVQVSEYCPIRPKQKHYFFGCVKLGNQNFHNFDWTRL